VMLSSKYDSVGESYLLSTYLRPFVLHSTIDTTLATINFSKGNVEEGVVDSSLSWEPVRTPICLPSFFKAEGLHA